MSGILAFISFIRMGHFWKAEMLSIEDFTETCVCMVESDFPFSYTLSEAPLKVFNNGIE